MACLKSLCRIKCYFLIVFVVFFVFVLVSCTKTEDFGFTCEDGRVVQEKADCGSAEEVPDIQEKEVGSEENTNPDEVEGINDELKATAEMFKKDNLRPGFCLYRIY